MFLFWRAPLYHLSIQNQEYCFVFTVYRRVLENPMIFILAFVHIIFIRGIITHAVFIFTINSFLFFLMADDTKFSQFSLLYAHICKQHTGAVRTTHLNTNGTCKLICLVKSTVGKYLKYCTKFGG